MERVRKSLNQCFIRALALAETSRGWSATDLNAASLMVSPLCPGYKLICKVFQRREAAVTVHRSAKKSGGDTRIRQALAFIRVFPAERVVILLEVEGNSLGTDVLS